MQGFVCPDRTKKGLTNNEIEAGSDRSKGWSHKDVFGSTSTLGCNFLLILTGPKEGLRAAANPFAPILWRGHKYEVRMTS